MVHSQDTTKRMNERERGITVRHHYVGDEAATARDTVNERRCTMEREMSLMLLMAAQ